MPFLHTTHGSLDESTLQRTVGFEDRPTEFVVWVEWRQVACSHLCPVCANPENPQTKDGFVLVRRDAHLILKQGSVVADAMAASIG